MTFEEFIDTTELPNRSQFATELAYQSARERAFWGGGHKAGYASSKKRAAEIATRYGEGKAVGFIANAIAEAIMRDGV